MTRSLRWELSSDVMMLDLEAALDMWTSHHSAATEGRDAPSPKVHSPLHILDLTCNVALPNRCKTAPANDGNQAPRAKEICVPAKEVGERGQKWRLPIGWIEQPTFS